MDIYNTYIKVNDIYKNIFKMLPRYSVFKKNGKIEAFNNDPLTPDEKKIIDTLISKNKFKFGYDKDDSMVLKYIISYFS